MARKTRTARPAGLRTADFMRLASFRLALRRFLHFSESAAVRVGLTGQQYQAMLAVRGNPDGQAVTINDLAQRLMIRHNSAVGLVDRLVDQKLMVREAMVDDRRKVRLQLTGKGEQLFARLASVHRAELQKIGPVMYRALREITDGTE
jgi:DNA-binding MarR family transcriptional regulator